MVMKMNREKWVERLQKETDRSQEECLLIHEILESHCIVGRNNKKKIINDFIEKLQIDDSQANKLYNICMENILKGILRS